MSKRYQAMPLELLGFDEAKSDLLFLQPILNASGMKVDEARLREAYDGYACNGHVEYFKELMKNPQSIDELEKWQSTPIDSEDHQAVPKLANITGELCEGLANKLFRKNVMSPVDYDNIEDTSNMVEAKTGVEREPKRREKQERYWVEVAKQLVNKNNTITENI